MKKILYAILSIVFVSTACHPTYVVQNDPAPAPAPPPAEVSYQAFYDQLSPYGHWIDYPGYGYVWMPNVGPDFKPYSTNGYWVYTDMGWTWASNYNWGWAPFHYGRWFYEGGYGWMWIPGHEWAPAWVSWRTNTDYYGWAPLGPSVNVNVSMGAYNPPSNYWSFVPHQYIASPHINNYYVNEARNVTIINNTTVINNVTYNNVNNTTINNNRNIYRSGPDPREVERASGSQLRPVEIRESNRPGEQLNNNQYSLYRPQVNAAPQQAAGNQQQRVAPSRVESLRDIRPMPASSANNNVNAQGNNNPPVNRTAESFNNNRANENLQNNNQRQEPEYNNDRSFNNNNNTQINRSNNNNQPEIRQNNGNTNTYNPSGNTQSVNNSVPVNNNNTQLNRSNNSQPDNRYNNGNRNNNSINTQSANTNAAGVNNNHHVNNNARLNNNNNVQANNHPNNMNQASRGNGNQSNEKKLNASPNNINKKQNAPKPLEKKEEVRNKD